MGSSRILYLLCVGVLAACGSSFAKENHGKGGNGNGNGNNGKDRAKEAQERAKEQRGARKDRDEPREPDRRTTDTSRTQDADPPAREEPSRTTNTTTREPDPPQTTSTRQPAEEPREVAQPADPPAPRENPPEPLKNPPEPAQPAPAPVLETAEADRFPAGASAWTDAQRLAWRTSFNESLDTIDLYAQARGLDAAETERCAARFKARAWQGEDLSAAARDTTRAIRASRRVDDIVGE